MTVQKSEKARSSPMELMRLLQRYPDHESCIERLETVRWGDSPTCPRCQSSRVARKADGARVGRWNCHQCNTSFNVLTGTVFQKTKIPMQKWFLAISMLSSAGESFSSHQLARHLDLNQKSAWFMAKRIRCALEEGDGLLIESVGLENRIVRRQQSGEEPEFRVRQLELPAAIGAREPLSPPTERAK